MVLHQEIFQAICSCWHKPQVDLVCHQVQQQAGTICFTGHRPPCLGSGCTQPVLGASGLLCFPTGSHLGQSGGEVARHLYSIIILIATGWPNMPWFRDLVAMSRQIPLCLPNLTNQLVQPDPSQESVKPECLAPRASAIKKQGFSETVAAPLRLLKEDQPDQSMRQSGPFLQSSATVIRWTSRQPL